MILFCDTSALVKLYVIESQAEIVRDAASDAEMICVSRLAWVELHAALARRGREVPESQPALDMIRNQFHEDWPHFGVLETTQPLVETAGEFADTFALRAYDAVQLASANRLQKRVDDGVVFACFDRQLRQAAKVLDMTAIPA